MKKAATRAQIDKFVTMQIRKSSKAPASFARERDRMRKAGTDIALNVKKQGKKLPWGILFIIGASILAIILFVLWKFKGGEGEGEGGFELGDKTVNLRDRDEEGLLKDFGHSKPGEEGQPGRPFDES